MEYLQGFSNPDFWVGLLKIIWINILLSGDNAVVIALAARGLPPEQQRKAKKDAADIALKQSQQQIERERIAAQSRDSDKRLVADALHKKADIAQETRAHHKDLLLDATKTILQNSKKGE